MRTATDVLLITDIQYDFCPGGALAIEEADSIIPLVNRLASEFPLVAATQDWHPRAHKSFAHMHEGKKPGDVIDLHGIEQILWPDHCVQSTRGAMFHEDLDTSKVAAIFRKGMDPEIDSYSAFTDNAGGAITGLNGFLKELRVKHIHLTGLATDFCVYYTAMDGIKKGYQVTIIIDAAKAIDQPPGSGQEKLERFEKAGGKIAHADEYL